MGCACLLLVTSAFFVVCQAALPLRIRKSTARCTGQATA